MTSIPGTVFTEATTINSMYAKGKIELKDAQGTYYRIDVSELLPLIQAQQWNLIQKTKYQHLTRAK
jgi:hypothetical protein